MWQWIRLVVGNISGDKTDGKATRISPFHPPPPLSFLSCDVLFGDCSICVTLLLLSFCLFVCVKPFMCWYNYAAWTFHWLRLPVVVYFRFHACLAVICCRYWRCDQLLSIWLRLDDQLAGIGKLPALDSIQVRFVFWKVLNVDAERRCSLLFSSNFNFIDQLLKVDSWLHVWSGVEMLSWG